MDGPDVQLRRLLVAASIAVRVVAMPVRQDGTTPREYESSGPTFANRIKADPASIVSVSWGESEPYDCVVRVKAGGVRQTLYKLWLRESPRQVDEILAGQERAARLRASLPHGERRKQPWGPL
ncbi:hypothetical protein [Caenimonas sedimenti]|uniref:hypothetical protein n=1 Tax=Caenimonas sedimenti TaxID=2596921 RepID=UPI0011A3AB4A|nr:hypothetical protein [Caenimonas sedimenti]